MSGLASLATKARVALYSRPALYSTRVHTRLRWTATWTCTPPVRTTSAQCVWCLRRPASHTRLTQVVRRTCCRPRWCCPASIASAGRAWRSATLTHTHTTHASTHIELKPPWKALTHALILRKHTHAHPANSINSNNPNNPNRPLRSTGSGAPCASSPRTSSLLHTAIAPLSKSPRHPSSSAPRRICDSGRLYAPPLPGLRGGE